MNKKLNILFLTRSFYPNIGGVEKHVLEISKILVKKGHSVTVVTEQPKQSYSKSYHSNKHSAKEMGKTKNIRTIMIQARKEGKLKKYLIWLELFKYLKVFLASDIVHCHDVFYWYLPFRFLFPFKKVYTTFHGYEGNNMPTKKAVLMHKISEKLSAGNICVGDFLNKWYGTKPTFVMYGAISKNLIKIDGNKFKKKDSKKIIFVGRLEKETGVMTYLKALKILKNKGLNFSVDLYGDGSLKNEVIKYSKTQKLNIKLKGFILNIENVLSKYEYIFCSRYLSILEGLAVKVPIFAEYNNAIKKDYLEMSPFAKYVSISKDSKEIADSLEGYITGKKTLDLNGGYNWVKDKTWDNVVNIYLKLWKFS